MWIFGLLAFYMAIGYEERLIEQERERKYDLYKEDWKITHCSRGEHFIGASAYTPHPFCEICHEYPKVTSLKGGIAESWKWDKEND